MKTCSYCKVAHAAAAVSCPTCGAADWIPWGLGDCTMQGFVVPRTVVSDAVSIADLCGRRLDENWRAYVKAFGHPPRIDGITSRGVQ